MSHDANVEPASEEKSLLNFAPEDAIDALDHLHEFLDFAIDEDESFNLAVEFLGNLREKFLTLRNATEGLKVERDKAIADLAELEAAVENPWASPNDKIAELFEVVEASTIEWFAEMRHQTELEEMTYEGLEWQDANDLAYVLGDSEAFLEDPARYIELLKKLVEVRLANEELRHGEAA